VSDLRERLAAAVDDAVPAVRVTRALRAFAAWLREVDDEYTYCVIAADAIDPQPERTTAT
jgi:hypothetical protein